MRLPIASLLTFTLASCSPPDLDAREALLASTLARADLPLLRTRPALVRGKFERMAAYAYDFYRGTLPVFQRDASDASTVLGKTAFPWAMTLVVGLGDPHPENFGVLRGSDEALALEANDFDSADVWPALWDLRRLLVGIEIGVRLSNDGDDEANAAARAASVDVLRACAARYVDALVAWERGTAFSTIGASSTGKVLEDLFERSAEDVGTELDSLTRVDGQGRRRFVRGADAEEPTHALDDLPEELMRSLDATLASYRTRLSRPFGAAYFERLDAVREFGSGVASWPRMRVLVLVRGPSDDAADDVVLEVKEGIDSNARGSVRPGVVARDVPERLRAATHAIWMRPDADPRWDADHWLGFPVQIRTESEGQKTLRVDRWVRSRGTPGAITDIAVVLGELLARTHSRSIDGWRDENARFVARSLSANRDAFIDEQVRVAREYADEVERDYARFLHVLDVLGPSLGIRADRADAPSPSLSALLGDGMVALRD